MNIEFEAKFLIDADQLKQSILSHGARQIKEKGLMRRFNFDLPGRPDEWLRVRDEGDKITCTYKSFDKTKGIESVQELEVVVDNFDMMCEILKTLGYKASLYVENYREIWKLDDCFIMIDQWPALDPIVEIEGSNKFSVEQVVAKLDLDMRKAFFGPTAQIYEKIHGISRQDFEKIEKLTFEDIPKTLNSKN